jgi:hypothetical protein
MDSSLLEAFGRRIRVGIVGGGTDSVIGRTHLIAMRADGLCDLVAGAMSLDPEIATINPAGRKLLLLAYDQLRIANTKLNKQSVTLCRQMFAKIPLRNSK